MLYVSEGLLIPPEQPELLRSVISEANRSNITFYALDARGLETLSNNRLSSMTNSDLNSNAGDMSGSSSGGDIQPSDLQVNARELAEGTGGFAMDNSNDLRAPLRRVMEDVRAHYEVTYSPLSTYFDGHFRSLEVRVARPGIKIQARKGYYALPLLNGETVAPFEIAALTALQAQPSPHRFEFHSAALRFSSDPAGTDYRIVFSIPSRALQFTGNPASKTFRVRASVMGLVKDNNGQIVERVSRDLPFEAPLDRKEEFQKGEVTISLPLHLPPGSYLLETVALDREASTASVRRARLVVPDPNTHIGKPMLSDFVWVRSVQPDNVSGGAPLEASDPFDTPDGRITPDLAPALTRADTAAFFFVLYPPVGEAAGRRGRRAGRDDRLVQRRKAHRCSATRHASYGS